MSQIDAHEHSYIGLLAKTSCYLLEEDTNDYDNYYLVRHTIMLGGGRGEHPAACILDKDSAVLNYLMSYAEYTGKDELFKELQDYESTMSEGIVPSIKNFAVVDKGWTLMVSQKFAERCDTYLNDPFDYKKLGNYEAIIVESIGELIILSLPHLMSDDLVIVC